MTYVNLIEDTRGDLVEIEHYCSTECFRQGTGKDAHGYRWPCPEQADYNQYCPTCGVLAVPAHGDECDE